MKLVVLVDNNVLFGSPLLGEHGLSFYIEEGNLQLLFDLGASDVFIKNAKKMQIDLSAINHIVFSHHHSDHTGGIRSWINTFGTKQTDKPNLIAHEFAFYQRENSKNTNNLFVEPIDFYFNVTKVTTTPVELSDNLIFLGEIERTNEFEGKKKFGKVILKSKEIIDDYCIDDSALVYKSNDGIVIISGCSHSGICNIIQYAKKVGREKWNDDRIQSIIGGLHLVRPEISLLNKTIKILQTQHINNLYACHCTDMHSKISFFKSQLQIADIGVGSVFEFI